MVTLLCLGSVLLVLSHLFENLIFFAPSSLFKLSSSALFGFTNPSLSFSQHGKGMDSSLFLKYSNHHTLGQSIKQDIFAVRDKSRLESLLKKDKIERTSSRAVMRGSIAVVIRRNTLTAYCLIMSWQVFKEKSVRKEYHKHKNFVPRAILRSKKNKTRKEKFLKNISAKKVMILALYLQIFCLLRTKGKQKSKSSPLLLWSFFRVFKLCPQQCDFKFIVTVSILFFWTI